MSNLSNVEKVEKTIFTSGCLTVKNVIILGKKGKDDVMYKAFYKRTYQTNKYSDHDSVEDIRVNTGDYLVFAYNDYKNKVFDDIYISYPHMNSLLNFMKKACTLATTKGVYVQNEVSSKYKDVYVQSDPFIGDKSLIILPTIIQKDQATKFPGVSLLLNSEDNYVDLDINGLLSLNYILKHFNLNLMSMLLLNFAATVDNTESSSNEDNDEDTDNFSSFNKGISRKQVRGFNFSRKHSNDEEDSSDELPKKKTKKIKSTKELGDIVNGNDEDKEDDDLPFTYEDNKKSTKKVNKKETLNTNKKKVHKSTNHKKSNSNDDKPLSFKNIVKEANSIKIPENLDEGDSDDMDF